MDESQIVVRLDAVIKLLAVGLIKGKSNVEAIEILGSTGLDRNTIASIIGVAPAQVRARLSELKKRNKKKHDRQN